MIRLPGGAGFSLGTGCHPLPSLRGCGGVQYTGSHRLPVYWIILLHSGLFGLNSVGTATVMALAYAKEQSYC